MDLDELLDMLDKKFASATAIRAKVHGLATVEVEKAALYDLLAYCKGEGFSVLMDLSGVDYLKPYPRTKVYYLLHAPIDAKRLRVDVYVGRDEVLPSVVKLWPGADWYERELYDLFGISIEGHPELKRILMPDSWEGYPLLRDYPLVEEAVQFKGGVQPKIPSEIIPHVP